MKYISLIFFSLLIFVSCSTENEKNIRNLKIGMTVKEVIDIMDNDYDIITDYADSNKFQLVYSNTMIGADDFRIYFNKNDSIAIDIGYGD